MKWYFTSVKHYRNAKDLEQLSVGYLKKDDELTTIYVGNLSYNKTEQALLEIFRNFGYVTFVRITRDRETLRSKGIAFVQMQNNKSAEKAIKVLNGSQLDGRTLKVSIAVESPQKPKRQFNRRSR